MPGLARRARAPSAARPGACRSSSSDPDGKRLPPGQQGTIYFEPPGGQYFEYRNAPEKTAAAHTRDGTAFTVGDIGYVDDDGYLYISGRTADVIVELGRQRLPGRDRERARRPAGAARRLRGGRPRRPARRDAGRVRGAQPGRSDDEAEAAVLDAVEAQLASYQRPRRVIVREALPRDPTGKLLRHVLRAELWEGQESIFAAPAGASRPRRAT